MLSMDCTYYQLYKLYTYLVRLGIIFRPQRFDREIAMIMYLLIHKMVGVR
jgi:hypothetical protein